jgi:hypothetical protein
VRARRRRRGGRTQRRRPRTRRTSSTRTSTTSTTRATTSTTRSPTTTTSRRGGSGAARRGAAAARSRATTGPRRDEELRPVLQSCHPAARWPRRFVCSLASPKCLERGNGTGLSWLDFAANARHLPLWSVASVLKGDSPNERHDLKAACFL